ncbi:MAG TPA: hypothetical protein PKM88_05180 [bacterium]|nr:hypothetical protein [bacterium]
MTEPAARPELIINGGDYDATELIRTIRAEIEADSRGRSVAPAPLTALPPALSDELAQLNLQARIDTRELPQSDRPGLGPLINAGKRRLRPLLDWLVVPLVDRVSDYFVLLVGYLYRLQEYLEVQAREDLPARVARLERAAAGTVAVPPAGAGAAIDYARYYTRLVAPRVALAEAIAPHCGGAPATVILGAARGELAAQLTGTVLQAERVAALAAPGAATPAEYADWLAAAELPSPCTLVIDDWAADWGVERLQAVLTVAARRLTRGSHVVMVLPLAIKPPYPLLVPARAVEPRVAAFLAECAGLTRVTATQLSAARCAVVRGGIA